MWTLIKLLIWGTVLLVLAVPAAIVLLAVGLPLLGVLAMIAVPALIVLALVGLPVVVALAVGAAVVGVVVALLGVGMGLLLVVAKVALFVVVPIWAGLWLLRRLLRGGRDRAPRGARSVDSVDAIG